MPQTASKSRSSSNHARPSKEKDKEKASAKSGSKNGSSEHPADAGKLEYEASLTTAEAVAYFASVIDGLKKGAVHFRHGRQSLTLTPSEAVAVEISASRKGSKQKVCFELRWDAATSGKLEID